jgi:hypothetical protein
MGQILPLKIDALGLPREVDVAADEITLASFTVHGGGPVLSATGLDLNNQDVSDVNDLAFNNPATATISMTAGAVIVDDLMAKDRVNVMAVDAAVQFPVVTDVAGALSALKLPTIAGAPSAAPTSGIGTEVYDSTNKKLYIWDGLVWDDQSTVSVANSVDNSFLASAAIAARDVVYIDAADHVNKAISNDIAKSQVIGFALAAAAAAEDPVIVRNQGIVSGFSGLTAGAKQYLSPSVAGGRSETLPTGTGNVIVALGYAKNTSDIFVQIQPLGRRA